MAGDAGDAGSAGDPADAGAEDAAANADTEDTAAIAAVVDPGASEPQPGPPDVALSSPLPWLDTPSHKSRSARIKRMKESGLFQNG
jgi:hypothetical protein